MSLPLILTSLLSMGLSQEPIETGTIRLYYLQHAIGYEHYELSRVGEELVLTSDFEFTDRRATVELDASLRMASDGTPRHFEAKGKSYRFVNVDSEVDFEERSASVRSFGNRYRVDTPERVFPVDGYAPFSVQMMLVRYWNAHGRPEVLAILPGDPTNEVRIVYRGRDEVEAKGKRHTLDRFTLEGVVWGRETLWLDERAGFAACVTRAGGLTFEGVREDLELPSTFIELAAKDGMEDLAAIAQAVRPLYSGSFALVGARVVDAAGSAPLPNATILVRDGRIEKVGARDEVAVPRDAVTVDVSGKTILPGLWDMHTHVTQIEWGSIYLAAGVTTVRDMGNDFELITKFRDTVDSDKALGPRILLAGLVDGGGPEAFGIVWADTPAEGRAVARRYHDAGFEQVKLYSLLQPEVVAAISSEGHELGMTVSGHVPRAMSLEEAVEAGMDHIAHLAIRDEPGSEDLSRTVRFLKEHGTVLDPTLSWGELLGRSRTTPIVSFQPGFAKIPVPLRRLFDSAASADATPDAAAARLRKNLRIVAELHRGGVPIVAGTDEGIPGWSLHREIELYVEAGLSPLDAIRAATLVPARSMGLEGELGTIEAGKRADLVVLDENPLENISNIRTVRFVVRDGKMYESSALWRSVRFVP